MPPRRLDESARTRDREEGRGITGAAVNLGMMSLGVYAMRRQPSENIRGKLIISERKKARQACSACQIN